MSSRVASAARKRIQFKIHPYDEEINFAIISSMDEISSARTHYYYLPVLHANLVWTCTHANADL
jgi:hypothetical protein